MNQINTTTNVLRAFGLVTLTVEFAIDGERCQVWGAEGAEVPQGYNRRGTEECSGTISEARHDALRAAWDAERFQ